MCGLIGKHPDLSKSESFDNGQEACLPVALVGDTVFISWAGSGRQPSHALFQRSRGKGYLLPAKPVTMQPSSERCVLRSEKPMEDRLPKISTISFYTAVASSQFFSVNTLFFSPL